MGVAGNDHRLGNAGQKWCVDGRIVRGVNAFPWVVRGTVHDPNWWSIWKSQAQFIRPRGDARMMIAELFVQPGQQRPLCPVQPRGRLARRVVVEQIIFVVAANHGPAFAPHNLDALAREWPPIHHITCHDHGIGPKRNHVGHHGFQRWQIAVNVRENSETCHARQISGMPPIGPTRSRR